MRRRYRFQLALGLAVGASLAFLTWVGRRPDRLQGRQVQVGASVGVTVSEATEVDAVLREADVAMYMAKAHGKGRFELASSSA